VGGWWGGGGGGGGTTTAVSLDFKNAYDPDPRMKPMGKLQATGG